MAERVIKGALVALEDEVALLDVSIVGELIAGLHSPGTAPSAADVIESDGLWLLPGAIDAHTHFTAHSVGTAREFSDGTAGAAAGGVTTVLEMPHALPPAVDLEGFAAKRRLCEQAANVDFGLWAGLTGVNDGQIAELAEQGAVGFKAFLCSPRSDGLSPDPTGLPALSDGDLLRAMQAVAAVNGIIGVHSENQDILLAAKADLIREGRQDMRAHALSGPELAEIEAVQRLVLFAQETGARTHVVHMASARAVDIMTAARGHADLSGETCMHYLCLDEEDLVRLGPVARCGPPLRPRVVVEALWARVLAGRIDMMASDHCPYPPELKDAKLSVWDAGMGLTGVETNVPMLISEGVIKRGLSLSVVARMIAGAPARRFRLPRKGIIRPGFDADLTLWDPSQQQIVRGAAFHGRAKFSAFEGWRMAGRLMHTILRGRDVYRDGTTRGTSKIGRFVRPG